MAQSAGYSPSFKPPVAVMRMRRSRSTAQAPRSSSGSPGTRSGQSPEDIRPFSPGTRGRSGAGVRRRNPFAQTEVSPDRARKKPRMAAEEDRGAEPSCGSADKRLQELPPLDSGLLEGAAPTLKSPVHVSVPPPHTDFPADWSLKTRLLFTSTASLGWAQQPRAQEEAQALSQHCRADFSPLPLSPGGGPVDAGRRSAQRAALLQALVYWQQPSLPWVSMFPRINADRHFSEHSTPWRQDTHVQQSLMREWVQSLSSIYSLLKCRLCPYFYLCSSQFTVLFRAAGLSGYKHVTAFVAPTTRGFRDALGAEGIEFSVPLMEDRHRVEQLRAEPGRGRTSLQTKSTDPRTDDGHASTDEDDGGDLGWLVEMGVQDTIRKPDIINIQLGQREALGVCVDHRPESVVCVEGAHTFSLINFFINSRSSVAAAGAQAGLPPTLLAPTAFRGATMHTLKSRCVSVKTRVGSSFQDISSLEITGPVLPSALHTVATLLRSAQDGNFSATLFSHAPTAVMNVHNPELQVADSPTDTPASGLPPSSLQQLLLPSTLGKSALTHLDLDRFSYTWRS